MPPSLGQEALSDDARLTSVWRLSRTQRYRKAKISTEVAHVAHDSDTMHFQGQRSTCRGRGHIVAASRSRTACYITFCTNTYIVDTRMEYLRTTDDKSSRRLEMEDGSRVDVLWRNDGHDDFVHQLLTNLREGHVVRVLDGHDDSVNTHWNTRSFLHTILARHLHTHIQCRLCT